MKNLLLWTLLAFCISLSAQDSTALNQPTPTVAQPTDMQQDVIVMTNGNIFKGKITQTDIETIDFIGHDGNVYQFHKRDILRITTEQPGDNPHNSNKAPTNISPNIILVQQEKSAGLAFLLSFLLPGGGQFYNNDNARGGVMTALYLSSSIVFYTGALNTNISRSTAAGLVIAGGSIALATWLWSVIDAPIRTNIYNRSLRKTSLRVVPDIQVNQTLMPGNLTSDLSVGLKLNLTY